MPSTPYSREIRIKGAFNGSNIGTLMDRNTRFVILAKVDDASAEAVLEGLSRRLRTLPKALRKTLTYDMTRVGRWLDMRKWKNAPI